MKIILIFLSILYEVLLQKTIQDFLTFQQYIKNYNKTYELNSSQYSMRKQMYEKRVELFVQLDCMDCAVNNYTDWIYSELKQSNGSKFIQSQVQNNQLDQINVSSPNQASPRQQLKKRLLIQVIPANFDWTSLNKITAVKDIKNCKGYWAYSTVAFLESFLIINYGYDQSLDLRQDYLIACDNYSSGCSGGFILQATQLAITKGFPEQTSIHLVASASVCSFHSKSWIKFPKLLGSSSYQSISDQQLIKKLIFKAPINAAVCSASLHSYDPALNGRTLSCDSKQNTIDHSLLIVGYTQNQWIVKNQWGTAWGINGYGYISRNSQNDCCIGDRLIAIGEVELKCSPTIQNCQTCIEGNVCSKCISGWYTKSGSTGQISCHECLQNNCKQCFDSKGTCKICKQGYVLSYNTNACVVNSDALMSSCQIVKDQTQLSNNICKKCLLGYNLLQKNSNKICEPQCNIPNCTKCLTPNNCTQCQSPLVPGLYGRCTNKCLVFKCFTCDKDQNCTQCLQKDKYKLSLVEQKTICVAVQCPIQYCLYCSSKNICTDCIHGFQLNSSNNSCYCENKRTFDQTTNTCICSDLYYQLNGDCNSCQQGCKQCTNDSYCTKCSLYYYLLKDVCYPCIQKCLVCQNNISCDVCQLGYYFHSVQIICKIVTSEINQFVKKDNAGDVAICPPACTACESSTSCTTCRPMYALNQAGYCQKCKQNCKICQFSTSSASPYKCLLCFQRFFNQNNLCKPCDQNCIYCAPSPSICKTCQPGYFLQNSKCANCNVQNCLQCKNSSFCLTCRSGHTVLTDGSCFQCLSGCTQCSINTLASCIICLSGTWLNNKTCSNCPSTCLTCVSSVSCTSCVNGYILTSNLTCLKICDDKNCYKCQNKSSECEECYAGYKLNSNVCTPDISCSIGLSCTACPDLYYLRNKQCLNCPALNSNCLKCNVVDASICYKCESLYFLSETFQCVKCSQQCIQCQSLKFCLTCSYGYYMVLYNSLITGKCSPCDDKCTSCVQKDNYCLSCIQNYQLNQHKLCLPRNRIGMTLQFDVDFKQYSSYIVRISDYIKRIMNAPDKSYYQIVKAYEGSTIIEAYYAVPVGLEFKQVYNTAVDTLGTGDYLKQVFIIYSSLTPIQHKDVPANNPVTDPTINNNTSNQPKSQPNTAPSQSQEQTQSSSSQQSASTWWIYVVILASLLILVIIGVIMYFACRKVIEQASTDIQNQIYSPRQVQNNRVARLDQIFQQRGEQQQQSTDQIQPQFSHQQRENHIPAHSTRSTQNRMFMIVKNNEIQQNLQWGDNCLIE